MERFVFCIVSNPNSKSIDCDVGKYGCYRKGDFFLVNKKQLENSKTINGFVINNKVCGSYYKVDTDELSIVNDDLSRTKLEEILFDKFYTLEEFYSEYCWRF